MKFFVILFVFFKGSEARKLWETALPEISVTTISSPIKLHNNENEVQIADLNGTLFSNSLSQLNVSELRIIHNQIRQIQPGALCSSTNLKILELDFSMNRKPPTLTKSMFNNCNLDELILKFDYNDPSTIEQDALEDVALKTLAIDSLVMNHLKKNFLVVRTSLNTLVLSNVHVNKIDSDVFSDFDNLEKLEIVHNFELTHLPQNVFKNLTKLKFLSLQDNALKKISWDEFEGLASLEELDVVDNQIGYFDADKIARNMPKLQKLYMDVNPVTCEQKQSFVKLLKTKLEVEVPSKYGDDGSC